MHTYMLERMRNVTTLYLLCLLVCGGYLFSQSVPVFTNTFQQARAVAAHLKSGMREEDVVPYMKSNGFYSGVYNSRGIGLSAASANYTLTNNCILLLDYNFTVTDGHPNYGHSRLNSVHIRSNNISIECPLTNAP